MEHLPQKGACERSLPENSCWFGSWVPRLVPFSLPDCSKVHSFWKRYPGGWIYDPEAVKSCIEEDNVSFQETWRLWSSWLKRDLLGTLECRTWELLNFRDVCNYARLSQLSFRLRCIPIWLRRNYSDSVGKRVLQSRPTAALVLVHM